MDSYLMMLYVTIEQESALKFFFVEQGWAFCKPDLSVTTDKLGPTTSVLPVVCEETEVFSGEIEPIPKLKVKIPAAKVSTKTAKRKGKRKSIKQTGRSTKLTKIMSSSLGTETNVTGVILDTDDVQNIHSGSAIAAALNAPFTQDELDIHSRSATDDALTFNAPFTVQFEDGNEMQIKVEKVAEDNESAVDDDGDDEDDTDLDYGYEGAVGGDSDVKSKGEVRADESVAKDDDCAPPKGSHGSRDKKPYEKENLKRAFAATLTGMSVYRASRMYCVPESTLRDRTRHNVSLECRPGPETLLSPLDEEKLAEHIKYMASIGYGYSMTNIRHMAADYARSIGKKVQTKDCLSTVWFYAFMKRHPDLKNAQPQKLDLSRAKGASAEKITNYFKELCSILKDNDILTSPERIYNIEETGVSTQHAPPKVVCAKDTEPQAITSPKSLNVTIIGGANALGNYVPPFFIFPGKRWNNQFLSGAPPGADGEMSDSGWVNSEIFENYVTKHLAKHLSLTTNGERPATLLLYDGHKFHLSLTLAEWAKKRNVIIFVLPPHTSHLTQPLDVGIYGPFKKYYYTECQQYLQQNPGMYITKYEIAKLTSKPYLTAFSPTNITSAFMKSGIFPFDNSRISVTDTAPSSIYTNAMSWETESNELI